MTALSILLMPSLLQNWLHKIILLCCYRRTLCSISSGKVNTSLYEEIILSIASAEFMRRFLAVVNALVLSLTPPSGSSSTLVPAENQKYVHHNSPQKPHLPKHYVFPQFLYPRVTLAFNLPKKCFRWYSPPQGKQTCQII